MPTKETAPRAQTRARAPRGPAKTRSLPERTLLVQLGAAIAVRESVVAATRPLASPGETKTRIAELGKGVGEGVKRLERRGERASSELQRRVKRVVAQVRRRSP